MARGLGKGIRQIKDASQDVQDEIRKTTTDMKRDVNINRALHEAKNTIESPIKEFTKDLKQSAVEVGKSIDGDTENTTKSIPSQETIETSDSKKEDDNIKLDQQKES